MNKNLMFKIARVVIFAGIVIFSSVMLFESMYLSWIIVYAIYLISGIVGLFIELYKK